MSGAFPGVEGHLCLLGLCEAPGAGWPVLILGRLRSQRELWAGAHATVSFESWAAGQHLDARRSLTTWLPSLPTSRAWAGLLFGLYEARGWSCCERWLVSATFKSGSSQG